MQNTCLMAVPKAYKSVLKLRKLNHYSMFVLSEETMKEGNAQLFVMGIKF